VGLEIRSSMSWLIIFFSAVVAGAGAMAADGSHNVKPKAGVVPDARTATAIAHAILSGLERTNWNGEAVAKLEGTNNAWTVRVSVSPAVVEQAIIRIPKAGGGSSFVEPAPSRYMLALRERGLVPDARTAAAIAEAVLRPIYGGKLVERERPYKASLQGDLWTVQGTLRQGMLERLLAPRKGGVALVEIRRGDAAIIRVTHGK
jgi:NTF2 fold immunity protein